MKVTASYLYSYIKCPHRIWRDAHDDQRLKDPPNEFVQLLWEQGVRHEKEVMARQGQVVDILDLSLLPVEERYTKTLEAMRSEVRYIYQGRLEVDDLVGYPDLLELQGNGEYMPIDIKSGMGVEGESEFEEGKYKKGYAVQLGLYIDALIRLGFLTQKSGKILDSHFEIVEYDLSQPRGPRTPQIWWDYYLETLARVQEILNKTLKTEPALGSVCKQCEWQSDCKKICIGKKCITLVPELGRSLKEDFRMVATDITQLAALQADQFVDKKGKTSIPGVGIKTLEKMIRRAKLLVSGKKEPLLLEKFTLPQKPIELFFDLEADPTQDIIYLHGVVERRRDKDESVVFHSFVAREATADAERKAWQEFWNYIRRLPKDQWAMFYYSKYERTQYRALTKKYPEVATAEEVELFFDPTKSVDLYFDVVKKYTDWPTYNHSVKTLAQHLGFKWRDENPSGAASIQWYNEWCDGKNEKVLQRILDYNEDDCLAMIKLKDALQRMID